MTVNMRSREFTERNLPSQNGTVPVK